jgi:TRAP-type mannitol/chloroaromatic compound transport system permease small subunit
VTRTSPAAALVRVVDGLSLAAAGLGVACLSALLGIMLFEVVARYGFGAPTVWGGDLGATLTAALFLLGGARTLRDGGHVRIDVLSRRLPAVVERGFGVAFELLLLLPTLGLLSWAAGRRAVRAYARGEVDLATAWHVPVWPLYTLIAATLALLALQVVAERLRQHGAAAGDPLPPLA